MIHTSWASWPMVISPMGSSPQTIRPSLQSIDDLLRINGSNLFDGGIRRT
jgi:hypothetical protein